jgi:hypothetical protein
VKAFAARYLLSLLLLNLAACSTFQPVDLENAMQTAQARGVDYGSLVEVRTLDGDRARFRVTEIGPMGIGGKPGFFRYEELRSLKVENAHANRGENALHWILGILGVAALVALVANADSVSVCSPSPCPEN